MATALAGIKVYVESNAQTIWLVMGTVLAAIVTTGGAIAVAIITTRQTKQGKQIEALHEQVKTSNGQTIGEMVETMAHKDGS